MWLMKAGRAWAVKRVLVVLVAMMMVELSASAGFSTTSATVGGQGETPRNTPTATRR